MLLTVILATNPLGNVCVAKNMELKSKKKTIQLLSSKLFFSLNSTVNYYHTIFMDRIGLLCQMMFVGI